MATTFLTLQQELADRLNLDQTVTTYATRLKRWINLTQQDICSRFPFDWQFSQEYVQTVTDKTAGTVSVANGGTAVTGIGTAFASTDKRSFIQFQSSTNWYEVTVVGGATSLTISPAFNETAVSGGTYTLRKRYYDLTSDVERVFDATESLTPNKLTNLGVWTLDMFQPDIETVSIPTGYFLYRQDPDIAVTASPVRQIGFFPIPDAVYNIEVKYLKYLSDLSGDTDVPVIPQQWLNVLLAGAEWLGSKYLNSDNENSLLQQYELLISKMIEQENSNDDYFLVLTDSDVRPSTRFLPFPGNFPSPDS